MKTLKIVWTSLVDNTSELLTLHQNGHIEALGMLVGAANEQPVGLSYRLYIDTQWRVKEVIIQFDGSQPFEAHYIKKGDKWFDENDNHLKDFDGVEDIDITLTPFTNTLPINRIRLQEHESQEISVMYFDMDESRVYRVRQRYTNLGNNNYRFEHIDTDFMAIIQVDSNGLLVDYPGLFKMVMAKEVSL